MRGRSLLPGLRRNLCGPLLSQPLLLLVNRQLMAHNAAGHGAGDGVLARHMAGDAADNGARETTDSLSLGGGEYGGDSAERANGFIHRGHLI
jgi:hypothetical protein